MTAQENEHTFIKEHSHRSTAEVALLLSKKPELDRDFILRQINGSQKAKQKFSFLLEYPDFEYPSARAVAQSSSATAAAFKATLLNQSHREIADLSGGMGIDSYFLAKGRKLLTYLEPDPILFEITKSNFKLLNAQQIECINNRAADFLNDSERHYDLLYLDPDRRKESKRMIRLEDCEPNVIELQDQLFKKSAELMIKFSPLMDLKLAIEQLKGVKKVIVLSIKNECKELLFCMEKDWEEAPGIKAVDLNGDSMTEFEFSFEEEESAVAEYSEPMAYLYEPNAAIMKAGAFQKIAEGFELKKLGHHTHLYTSDRLNSDFPGRILKVLQYDKSPKVAPKKVNLVNRNSGMTVAEMKQKFKFKDGGTEFLYACRLENGKRIFVLGEMVGNAWS